MRLPDFFIVGAMKAATTTLHDQLARQPGIVMSDPKELYYFSDDPIWARGPEWYSSHFREVGPTDLCGESSTHYAKLPTYPHTVERIASTISNPRFIYLMRHPIDRLISQFQHMRLEREIDTDFDSAIDGGVPELIEYSRYSYQLMAYLEVFGSKAILPVFFDRLLAHPQDELERVCAFVGYEEKPMWQDDITSNSTTQRLAPSRTREYIKSIPIYSSAARFVPDSLIERVRERWRAGERPVPSPADRARLERLFDQDLATLGEWLGTDLCCSNFRSQTLRPLAWTAAAPSGGR